MTLTDEQMKRVDKLSEQLADGSSQYAFDHVKRAILAALSDPLLVGGWKTIESAPKDREIIVYNSVRGRYVTKWDNGKWPSHGWKGIAGVWYPEPTHWRELPPPPGGE